MLVDFGVLAIAFFSSIYFILPAYFSNGAALIFGGGLPVDFRKTDKNGARWIGDGVTWRGLIGGTLVGTITGTIQGYFGGEIIANFGQYITTPIITDIPVES